MEFPKTLQEFQTAFPDEEACWDTLRQARWPDGFVCPRCGEPASSWISTRRLEQCRRCRYQCSLTAGTVFHRTRLPLLTWFWAIFFVARHKQGISALQLQRDTGIGSYGTAWALLHRLRSALCDRASAASRLSGLVEVDESYVGGPEPGRRGGREVLHKSIVAVAVEQRAHTAGRARLSVLHGVSLAKDLGPFIQANIDAKATVRTDGMPAYYGLPAMGIRHDRQVQGYAARSSEILPWAHTIFGNLKTWLRGTFHGVSGKHLPRYLDEFVYRFDRRWREGELFGFVLRRAARGEPLSYHRLVAEAAA